MKNNIKLKLAIGIPASGKSYYGKMLSEKEGYVVVSTDDIREKLYGDASNQGNWQEIEQEVYKQIDSAIAAGSNIYYDATNKSRKRRAQIIQRYNKKADVSCIYFATPFEECLINNMNRDRNVPYHVMKNMYLSLDIPEFSEGWSTIEIIANKVNRLAEISFDFFTEEELFENAIFDDIFNLDQENVHHIHSVSKHSWLAYRHVFKLDLPVSDKRILCFAAAFHDIGKGVAKTFNKEKGKIVYYGHEKASAQKAMALLYSTMNSENLILLGELISNHMLARQNEKLAMSRVSRPDLLALLMEADIAAH